MNSVAINPDAPVIECRNLAHRFVEGGLEVQVLRDVNLRLQQGERVAIVGASGSGKSTLLHLLGGLDTPTSGEVRIQGVNLGRLNGIKRGELRNRAIGFVYQFHHLLPEFTALENVAMPLLIRGVAPREASAEAGKLLDRVGLGDRLKHKPGELSGGERQRAAVARALITRPACLLADEPTGNLDAASGDNVYDLMIELNKAMGTGMVVVTHDPGLAEKMDTVYTLADGVLA
ncbi:MAG TPA: lipoprotein-releasing ABC transporter ATP-binding protein LolD [Gammaproteobacteria bacterium]|nr:lipoprotein-releasing ABC transporter ATP-binding protein LolD [Gammaproteobacteria bacterium]